MLRRGLCWLLCAVAAAMSWLLWLLPSTGMCQCRRFACKIGSAHRQMLANGAPLRVPLVYSLSLRAHRSCGACAPGTN